MHAALQPFKATGLPGASGCLVRRRPPICVPDPVDNPFGVVATRGWPAKRSETKSPAEEDNAEIWQEQNELAKPSAGLVENIHKRPSS